MRRRTLLLAAVATVALVAGCSDGDSAEPTPATGAAGPVPTATPFPTEPVPTIVTGEGTPGGGSTETTYEVQPGDTLSGIAAANGVTVEDIQAANDLTDTDIFVGQQLTIPGSSDPPDDGGTDDGTTDGGTTDGGGTDGGTTDGGTTDGGTTDGGTDDGGTPSGGGDTETYTVQPGDTAIGIADEFGVTLEELAAANDMTVDELTNLFAGQDIQIPTGN